MIMQTFGQYLKRERMRCGLSQRELAQKTGICNVHLSYFERGKRFPNSKAMIKLEKQLGLDMKIIEKFIVAKFFGDK